MFRIRLLKRNKLPFGKFPYLLLLKVRRERIHSENFEFGDVKRGFAPIRSNRVRKQRKERSKKWLRFMHLNFDQLLAFLTVSCSGKYRIKVSNHLKHPISIHFEKQEDIFLLALSQFGGQIFKIYKINLIDSNEETTQQTSEDPERLKSLIRNLDHA